jgi:transporter family-2 protein
LKSDIILGALGALATGIAIGTQSTLSSLIGALVGNLRTGMFMNFIGGIIAGIFILAVTQIGGKGYWQMPGKAVWMLVIAGSLGIMIITGVSFSLQRTGVAAGLATVILGQLVISVIVDATGAGGVKVIPFNWQRGVGLLVIALGVYLILPKK